MKIKVEKDNIFASIYGVTINGVHLTGANISDYDLHKMPRKSTDKEDVYKLNKKDRGFYIVHNKTNGSVNWYESLG